MALPTYFPKLPRPVALTVRLSEVTIKQIRGLQQKKHLSQADVIEFLLDDYCKDHPELDLPLRQLEQSKSQHGSRSKGREQKK